jgi:hypothetical protein
MARLGNAANFGYVPLSPLATAAIPTYIDLPDLTDAERQRLRICDPCVGEGGALSAIADGLSIPKARRYACDIHAGRAQQAATTAGHVLCGDALKSLVAAERAFACLYCNPPFDNDGAEEGGGRLEEKFFDRAIRTGRWVQSGGIVILVAPQDIFARPSFLEDLASCLDATSAHALPSDIRHFREVVVFGVARKRERRGEERAVEHARLARMFAGVLPILAPQTEPRYRLPIPEERRVVWKLAASGSAREAQQDVAVSGGAWNSTAYQQRTRASAPVMHPLMPMKRAYIGFAIANGRLNGTTLPIGEAPHLVKGGTIEQVLTQTEEHRSEGTVSTIQRTIRQQVACITGVSLVDGAVRQFVGADGLTALMRNPDTAQAITEAAVAAMPPFYAFDMEPWLERYLASIRPPLALPGYPRCVIPMQQHLVAAGIRGLNIDDPAWRRVRRAHIISATMGCGKSVIGTLTADAQVQFLTGEAQRWAGVTKWGDGSLTTNGVRRAPIVIVSAPGHLIGTQAQVDAFFDTGTGALPQWYAEWRGLLGNRYHMRILETPADVGSFFRGALADPTTPRVGFIADTVMKLDSGYAIGAERLDCNRLQRRRATRFHDSDERERKQLDRLRKGKRRQAQAAARASEDREEADAVDLTDAIARAETPEEAARLRRIQRDMTVFGLGRAVWVPLAAPDGTVHTHPDGTPILQMRRAGQQRMIRNGLCCPHCGRMARTSNGEPLAAQTLKQRGLAKVTCDWCGEKLGQRSREQDNVNDRALAVFTDPAWRTQTITSRDATGAERVVPATTTRLKPITRLPDGTVFPRPRYPLPDGARVEWVVEEHPAIPWGERPRSNPRYALAKLIRRRWKGFVDVYIADEFHECAGRSTAIGSAFGALCSAARFRVAMSGTGMNGYAASLYYPLLRMGCVPVQDRYGWDDEQRFVEECGILMEITHTSQRVNGAGHFSGEPRIEVSLKQMPGMTALLGEIFCNVAAIVDLPDMGFHLPDYSEDAVILPMPDAVRPHYAALEDGGKQVISFGGHDALSAYLQATLSYPYQPWTPKTIASALKAERAGNSFAGPVSSTVLPRDSILPHHEWLAEFAAVDALEGRRVLVGIEHTGVDDLMPDVADKITRIARRRFGVSLNVAILRSTIKRGERALWFKAREQEGVHVVLTHPKLVKTGMNLIEWPSIVVLEPNYSLEVVAQFIRRSFRPTQTKPVKVRFVCYAETMSERAIELVAQKMGTLAMLNGNEFMTGISAIGEGMSILQQLAQAVTSEQPGARIDMHAAFSASAQVYQDSMGAGAEQFIGVDISRVVNMGSLAAISRSQGATVVNVTELPRETVVTIAAPKPGTPVFGQMLAVAFKRRKAAKQDTSDQQLSMFDLRGTLTATQQAPTDALDPEPSTDTRCLGQLPLF